MDSTYLEDLSNCHLVSYIDRSILHETHHLVSAMKKSCKCHTWKKNGIRMKADPRYHDMQAKPHDMQAKPHDTSY